jgi:hypothetical protein
MIFNKQYWIEQLTKEVGLEGVPYEELSNHFVNFDSFFGSEEDSPTSKVNAKEYVDRQLVEIEKQYEEFSQTQDALESFPLSPSKSLTLDYNESDIFNRLGNVANSDVKEMPFDQNYQENKILYNGIPLILPVQQNIQREDIGYYEVFVEGRVFIVAINKKNGDLKTEDQINHIKSTSYFVEEINPLRLVGGEEIISYYQFANMIEEIVRRKGTVSVDVKLKDNVKTEFDGIKLDNFL